MERGLGSKRKRIKDLKTADPLIQIYGRVSRSYRSYSMVEKGSPLFSSIPKIIIELRNQWVKGRLKN